MRDSSAIRALVRNAFGAVPRPAPDEIAPHRCLECDALRDALAPFTAEDVPPQVLREHVFDLPLLSANAKHYYLPAWVYASLSEDSWNYVDALLANIDSNERFDPPGGYTDEQWEAILEWLQYLEVNEEEVTQDSARSTAAEIRRRREA